MRVAELPAARMQAELGAEGAGKRKPLAKTATGDAVDALGRQMAFTPGGGERPRAAGVAG